MYKYLDEGVHAEVLDFPGVITCGSDLEEARRLLAGALVDMAETNLLRGEPLPQPDPACTDPDADIEEPIHLLLKGKTAMPKKTEYDYCDWLRTPLGLIVLCTVAVAFGGHLALLALREPSGPQVVMTISTGAMFLSGLTLAIISARRVRVPSA